VSAFRHLINGNINFTLFINIPGVRAAQLVLSDDRISIPGRGKIFFL
jgi:hypothetical protein